MCYLHISYCAKKGKACALPFFYFEQMD